jgi:hypothetical protein
MHITPTLLALLPCAAAEFLVITDYPAALATLNLAQVRRAPAHAPHTPGDLTLPPHRVN